MPRMIVRPVFLVLTLAAGIHAWAQAGAPVPNQPSISATARRMKITIKTDKGKLTATLDDNASAKAFAQLLPLDLTLQDYNGTEKISDLPGKLSTAGAPEGIDPTVGDITYYAPWGNLAIFYRDFRYSSGLVRLGRLDAGIGGLREAGAVKVRIELGKSD